MSLNMVSISYTVTILVDVIREVYYMMMGEYKVLRDDCYLLGQCDDFEHDSFACDQCVEYKLHQPCPTLLSLLCFTQARIHHDK